jgi:trehalose/maltose hydrolase-like predicted phosphorylase
MKTATIDLTGKGKQYVGTLYIGGTHPAGNGGAWMSAVFGLCGINCAGDTISITPHLPSHWNKVTLPLIFRGQKLRITITRESVAVKLVEPFEAPLSVSVSESTYPIQNEVNIQTP